MRKNREEHYVTALEWSPEGRRSGGPKKSWKMVEDERSDKPKWMETVLKPYAPYGTKRYRIRESERTSLKIWFSLYPGLGMKVCITMTKLKIFDEESCNF